MSSASAVILWVLFLGCVRFGLVSFLKPLFKTHTKALSLPVFFLLSGYIYWLLSHPGFFSLPIRATLSVLLCFALMGVYLVFLKIRIERPTFDLEDLLFWGLLALCLLIRAQMASWSGSEKFPDLAFFQATFLDETYPPVDRWLPPFKVNYYYLSFVLFVPSLRVLNIPPEIAVNLVVSTILPMCATVAYEIVFSITKSQKFSYLSAGYMSFLGNWEWMKQVVDERFSVKGFSWWNSSRSIPYAITEFPFFSFLLGDFHPHFTSLPWLGLTLWMLHRATSWLLLPFTALSLGMHYPMNAWPFPILVIISVYVLWRQPRKLVALGLMSFIFYAPYWFQFERPISGVFFVPYGHRSYIFDLFQHWALFLIPLFIVIVPHLRKIDLRRLIFSVPLFALGSAVGLLSGFLILFAKWWKDRSTLSLTLLGSLMIVLFCEFIYLDPTYGDPWLRMNTVFKFYMVVWWLLSIGVPVMLWREQIKTRWIVALVLLSLVYPVTATWKRTQEMKHFPVTLNGMKYWEQTFPGEIPAANWIVNHTESQDVLLEAVGPPYQEFSKYSAFTGRPSYIGWVNHERVWRKNNSEASDRERLFLDLIRQGTPQDIKSFLQNSGISWVIIGKLEKETFGERLLKELSAYPVVFSNQSVTIHAVK